MRAPLAFARPDNSPAILALLKAAQAEGQDERALKNLLWLINAHPDLVSHASVFHRVNEILARQTGADLTWADDWQTHIKSWQALCTWIVDTQSALSQQPDLKALTRTGRDAHHNPLMRHGVGRHAIVTALLNAHEDSLQQPRYLELQGHVLLSYIDSRFQKSTLEQYLAYDGEREHLRAPSPTEPTGRVLRNLSLAAFTPLLQALPLGQALSAPEFAQRLAKIRPNQFPAEQGKEIQDGFVILKRYFGRFLEILAGGRVRIRSPKREEGTGGHRLRHGHVGHLVMRDAPLLLAAEDDPGDPDIPFQELDTLALSLLDEGETMGAAVQAGAAEREMTAALFQLYDPTAPYAKLHRLHYRQRALEMANQRFAWDVGRLLPAEVEALQQGLAHVIETFLCTGGQNQKRRQETVLALLLEGMLYLGQSLERVVTMTFVWANHEADLPSLLNSGAQGVQVVLKNIPHEEGGGSASPNFEVLGYLVPAITPSLSGTLRAETHQMGMATASNLLLPDCSDFGTHLHGYLMATARDTQAGKRVIGIELPQAQKHVPAFLNALAVSAVKGRVTQAKIQRQLQSVVLEQTGDDTLAWIASSDLQRANEPRMHYTQYPMKRVLDAYHAALGAICRFGVRNTHHVVGNLWVGARFVASTATVKGLVEQVQRRVTIPGRDVISRDQVVAYHNDYVFFTWLHQALATGMRAIKAPDALARSSDPTRTHVTSKAQAVAAGLSDKDTRHEERARLVTLAPALGTQLRRYARHLEKMRALTGLSGELTGTFCILETRRGTPTWTALSPTWIAEHLESMGLPLPANFHRAFLRTQLLSAGCPAEVIDAFMGHANLGELPFGPYSSFDYGRYGQILPPFLESLRKEIGLIPVGSRLLDVHNRRGR